MSGKDRSRQVVTTTNKQLEAGLEKYYPKGSFVLAGKTYKTSDLVTLLEKEDTLIASAVTAHAAWQTAASAARAQTDENHQLRLALKDAVKQLLGPGNASQLQEFGFSVTTRKPLTGPTIVGAAEKAKATRQARGTLGLKQRLEIHGVAPTPTAEPSPTPAVASSGATQK
jgi:hypothetical protein